MNDIHSKIWYDFVHTKYGDEYLIRYLARQKGIRKVFKVCTIIFSASGIFAFPIWDKAPLISCIGIMVVQVLSSVESYLIHSEDQISEVSRLRIMYYNRNNKLEKLLHDLNNNKTSEVDASEYFFELRDSAAEIEALDNELNIKKYKRLIKKTNTVTANYFKTYYNV